MSGVFKINRSGEGATVAWAALIAFIMASFAAGVWANGVRRDIQDLGTTQDHMRGSMASTDKKIDRVEEKVDAISLLLVRPGLQPMHGVHTAGVP